MKKLCVFDLDGTLVDSIEDIAVALNISLQEMGKSTHSTDKYYQMIGNGMDMLCRRAIGDAPEEQVQELIGRYKRRYQENCCVRTYAYDGIKELLHALSQENIHISVLSNKPHQQTVKVVSTILPDVPFTSVLGQSEQFPKKPDPTSLMHLIHEAGVTEKDTVYIGDSDVDMLLAANAGVTGIGAAWGFRGAEELTKAGAAAVANNAQELKQILLQEL